jgi:hypothetical protein
LQSLSPSSVWRLSREGSGYCGPTRFHKIGIILVKLQMTKARPPWAPHRPACGWFRFGVAFHRLSLASSAAFVGQLVGRCTIKPGLPPSLRVQFSFSITPLTRHPHSGACLALAVSYHDAQPHQRFPILLRSHPFVTGLSTQPDHPSDVLP